MKLATGVLHAQSVDAPIVGVAAMACIKCYERMIKPPLQPKDSGSRVGRGVAVPYPSSLHNDQWGAQLNPNHTHFIAVDSGWERTDASRSGPWGHEQALRAGLERAYAARTNALIVMLLVQGGLGSVQAVLESAAEEIPSERPRNVRNVWHAENAWHARMARIRRRHVE